VGQPQGSPEEIRAGRRKASPRTTEPGVPGFDRSDTLRQGADLGEPIADLNALGFELAFDPSERTQDFV